MLLAVVAGLTVHRTTDAAARRAAALGEMRHVAVAAVDLDAGSTIESGDLELLERPIAHLPDGAVLEDPTGSSLRASVTSGEILVDDRIAGEGRSGAAALVPDGWRAITIPAIDSPIPAEPGDLVDVIASFDPALSARDPSLVIAADAVVVDVADDAMTIAVTRARVTEVAYALANGIVTLVLVG
ncbi:MAG: flagella basal body P-ring formation protein FlgA [Acidimicrobiales bacterium]|nr:flagella basal body P-ring formation protein FlgA [Acidimicrobiales bacterium]